MKSSPSPNGRTGRRGKRSIENKVKAEISEDKVRRMEEYIKNNPGDYDP